MTLPKIESRRWGSLTQLREHYPLSRTRAYQLLAQGKLRAKRLGGRTIWDFESADALFDALPDLGEGCNV